MQLPESLPRILAGSMVFAFLVLNVAWLGDRWHPTGNDEVTHLQNTHNVATAWSEAPIRGFVESWMGRYEGEERTEWWPGGSYLFASPFVWVSSSPQAPLLALFPAFFLLLLAVRRGALDLDPSLASAGAWGCWLLAAGPSCTQPRELQALSPHLFCGLSRHGFPCRADPVSILPGPPMVPCLGPHHGPGLDVGSGNDGLPRRRTPNRGAGRQERASPPRDRRLFRSFPGPRPSGPLLRSLAGEVGLRVDGSRRISRDRS